MDINELKKAVSLLEYLSEIKDESQPKKETTNIGVLGRKVIVRSKDAGVIYGEYAGNEGSTVHLKNGIQMWKWFAAKGISLIDVAIYGIKKSECKFSAATATVTIFNACALIDVTEEAASSIESVLK